jgi:hypothetical protein
MKAEVENLRQQLSKGAGKDDVMEAEELVVAPSPLHAQLVHCVAEHAAIEDTLFYLSKAFTKRLIPLSDYLMVWGGRGENGIMSVNRTIWKQTVVKLAVALMQDT